MATNYPAGSDNFTAVAPDDLTSDTIGGRTHSAILNDMGDAVEAVQTELGANPSGSEATVAARLDGIESGSRLGTDSVGSAQIAANAVGSSELADNAVDTAAIQDSAVTSAKIAAGTIVSSDVAADTFAAFGTVGNLLTANQATVNVDTTGFQVVTNCTIAQRGETSDAAGGLGVTSVAAGDVMAGLNAPYIPVVAGETYTATFETFAYPVTAVATIFYVWWGAGGPISFAGADGKAVAGYWQRHSYTGVAPAGAISLEVRIQWTASAGGERIIADKWGVWKGAGGTWAMPGTPIVGLGIRPNPSNTAEVQIWNDATATWITV